MTTSDELTTDEFTSNSTMKESHLSSFSNISLQETTQEEEEDLTLHPKSTSDPHFSFNFELGDSSLPQNATNKVKKNLKIEENNIQKSNSLHSSSSSNLLSLSQTTSPQIKSTPIVNSNESLINTLFPLSNLDDDLLKHDEMMEIIDALQQGVDLNDYVKEIGVKMKKAEENYMELLFYNAPLVNSLHNSLRLLERDVHRLSLKLHGYIVDLNSIHETIYDLKYNHHHTNINIKNHKIIEKNLNEVLSPIVFPSSILTLLMKLIKIRLKQYDLGIEATSNTSSSNMMINLGGGGSGSSLSTSSYHKDKKDNLNENATEASIAEEINYLINDQFKDTINELINKIAWIEETYRESQESINNLHDTNLVEIKNNEDKNDSDSSINPSNSSSVLPFYLVKGVAQITSQLDKIKLLVVSFIYDYFHTQFNSLTKSIRTNIQMKQLSLKKYKSLFSFLKQANINVNNNLSRNLFNISSSSSSSSSSISNPTPSGTSSSSSTFSTSDALVEELINLYCENMSKFMLNLFKQLHQELMKHEGGSSSQESSEELSDNITSLFNSISSTFSTFSNTSSSSSSSSSSSTDTAPHVKMTKNDLLINEDISMIIHNKFKTFSSFSSSSASSGPASILSSSSNVSSSSNLKLLVNKFQLNNRDKILLKDNNTNYNHLPLNLWPNNLLLIDIIKYYLNYFYLTCLNEFFFILEFFQYNKLSQNIKIFNKIFYYTINYIINIIINYINQIDDIYDLILLLNLIKENENLWNKKKLPPLLTPMYYNILKELKKKINMVLNNHLRSINKNTFQILKFFNINPLTYSTSNTSSTTTLQSTTPSSSSSISSNTSSSSTFSSLSSNFLNRSTNNHNFTEDDLSPSFITYRMAYFLSSLYTLLNINKLNHISTLSASFSSSTSQNVKETPTASSSTSLSASSNTDSNPPSSPTSTSTSTTTSTSIESMKTNYNKLLSTNYNEIYGQIILIKEEFITFLSSLSEKFKSNILFKKIFLIKNYTLFFLIFYDNVKNYHNVLTNDMEKYEIILQNIKNDYTQLIIEKYLYDFVHFIKHVSNLELFIMHNNNIYILFLTFSNFIYFHFRLNLLLKILLMLLHYIHLKIYFQLSNTSLLILELLFKN